MAVHSRGAAIDPGRTRCAILSDRFSAPSRWLQKDEIAWLETVQAIEKILSEPVCGRALHSQVAALLADGIRFHQVGVYLRLVDKAALGAP
jgi:hypothetical protein